MTTIEQSINQTMQALNEHTATIIRNLAQEHGFDADEAIQKYMALKPSPPPAQVTVPKKGKKAKDTNKPKNPNKKPLNSYFLWKAEAGAQVKEANPDMKPSDIAKELKEMWAELGEDAKAPYKEKADAAMAEWKEATANWKESLTLGDISLDVCED